MVQAFFRDVKKWERIFRYYLWQVTLHHIAIVHPAYGTEMKIVHAISINVFDAVMNAPQAVEIAMD